MSLRALRAAYPVGGAKRIYAIDAEGHYAGAIDSTDLHDALIDEALDGAVAGDLAAAMDDYLLPSDNIRTALTRFDTLQIETLPVLLSAAERRVVGYVTEAYALKRYTQEMERMRGDELGQPDLFSIGPLPTVRTPGFNSRPPFVMRGRSVFFRALRPETAHAPRNRTLHCRNPAGHCPAEEASLTGTSPSAAWMN